MTDPHAGQPVSWQGPEPSRARLVVICVHGRGATAADILRLAGELDLPDVAYAAPQAAGRTWYPFSFLAPFEQNEPALSSALHALRRLHDRLTLETPPERVGLLGFSQGACLALEFAARYPRGYPVVAGLSGGLIGPPGTPRDYAGSLSGTSVFLGCSDADPHVPAGRVHESAAVLRQMGATVDERLYRGLGHGVNRDELLAVRSLLAASSQVARLASEDPA